MLEYFDFIREMTLLGVALRMVTAVICGGLIGLEREYRRRTAGFRTHILICMGAAITTLTSQYMLLELKMFTDVSRLGAQVIAGIGFIGAGTIIVTNNKRVKGLTTAAGMWTAAIIGLVCGAGFVECAIIATLAVLFAEILLIHLEFRFARKLRDINLYVEYDRAKSIESIIRSIKEKKVRMNGLEISRITGEGDEHSYCAIINIQTSREKLDTEVIEDITAIEGVLNIEEL